MNTDDIILKIKQMMLQTDKHPFVIAIDGMSASGKTTLALKLHEHFPDSNLFHMDDYFLQPHQRTPKRLSEIGGNVDYERFKEEIIAHLTDNNGFTYRKFHCQTQSLGELCHVSWQPLVIIEGAYSRHPYFGEVYDLTIFCEISKETQRERILKRNGEAKWKRFESEWIPKENAYYSKESTFSHTSRMFSLNPTSLHPTT